MKFARNMLVVLLAALAGASAAQDPTRPSPVLADRLREKALDAQTLRVKALVVGAGEEGVALVGAAGRDAAPVRKGARFRESVDGVSVALTVKGVTPKGVELETEEVFLRKIETAVRFRTDPNFLIIARSDAAAVGGEEDAIRRLNRAADAGADMGFIFSTKGIFETLDSVRQACAEIKVPVLYCLMEFCPEVCFTLDQLREAGVGAVIWPNGLLMRWCQAATELVEQFKTTGDCGSFYHQLMPIDQCNDLLGIRDWNPPGMFRT